MPRHEVSVVNLQLGIKASKYLIHQTRFVYASRVSFGKRWRRNSIRVALLQSLRRKKKNACLKKKKKFLEISDSKRHWPSEICLLYLPFGWTSSVGWLKLASTGDTTMQHCIRSSTAKTNFAEIPRHLHGLCRDCSFTSPYDLLSSLLRPCQERGSHETGDAI